MYTFVKWYFLPVEKLNIVFKFFISVFRNKKM